MKEIGPNLCLKQNFFSVQTILKIQESSEFYSTIELSLTYCNNEFFSSNFICGILVTILVNPSPPL